MTIKDNYGNAHAGVVVDGEDLAFGITTNCKSWSMDNYFIFDTEIESGKYYILSFDYKGHNYDKPVSYGAFSACDGSAFSGSKVSAGVPSTRADYKNVTRIIKGDDLLASNRKYFGFTLQSFNTANDQATTLVKNISLKEVTAPEGCLVPIGFATNAGIVELENNEFAFGIHQSENWEDGYLLFDYELKLDRKYKLSFDTRVHSYQTPISIGSTYAPNSTAGFTDSRKIALEEPSSAGKFTHVEYEFNGSSLYGVDGDKTAKYFAFKLYSYGGAGNPANVLVKNVKIIDITPADYSAVNEAIAAANALNKANYIDFSAVDAAIAAVVEGKSLEEQAEVDAMADAILAAIDALVYVDGFITENGQLYYCEDGAKALNKGVICVDGKYYYIGFYGDVIGEGVHWINDKNLNGITVNGEALKAGLYTINADNTIKILAGLVEEGGELYYYENGQIALNKGLVLVEGKYYFIGADGYALGEGVHWINEKNLNGLTVNGEALKAGLYTVNADLTVKILAGLVEENGELYYYEGGKIATNKGLVLVDGKYYFIGADGYALGEGKHWINEKNLNGLTANGEALKVGFYTVNADCTVVILAGIVEEDGKLYYYENGVKVAKGLVYDEESGNYYCFGINYYAIGEGEYFFNEIKLNGQKDRNGEDLKAGFYTVNADCTVVI